MRIKGLRKSVQEPGILQALRANVHADFDFMSTSPPFTGPSQGVPENPGIQVDSQRTVLEFWQEAPGRQEAQFRLPPTKKRLHADHCFSSSQYLRLVEELDFTRFERLYEISELETNGSRTRTPRPS